MNHSIKSTLFLLICCALTTQAISFGTAQYDITIQNEADFDAYFFHPQMDMIHLRPKEERHEKISVPKMAQIKVTPDSTLYVKGTTCDISQAVQLGALKPGRPYRFKITADEASCALLYLS